MGKALALIILGIFLIMLGIIWGYKMREDDEDIDL